MELLKTLSVVVVLGTACIGLGTGSAQAESCSAQSVEQRTACETAKWQATREPFTGKTAPIQVDTCVRLLVSEKYHSKSEVVLVAGDDPVNGQVITSLARGAGYAFRLPGQPSGTEDVYVREFCFDGSLIENFSTITFCNGTQPGDGNHHTLSMKNDTAGYLRRLKRSGHAGDFLTLLGTKRSYNAPVSTFFTESRYDRMF